MVPCRRRGMGAVDDSGVALSYPGEPGFPAQPQTSWWQNLITGAAKTAENVITQQNLARGVYTQTGPGGVTTYVQPAGSSGNIFTASSTGIAGSGSANPGLGIVLVGGAALLLVFMLAKR